MVMVQSANKNSSLKIVVPVDIARDMGIQKGTILDLTYEDRRIILCKSEAAPAAVPESPVQDQPQPIAKQEEVAVHGEAS